LTRIDLPIGVFDSGVGGLTVLAALRARLPAEDLLYLGDTARVPYGTRAPETVVRYARRVAGHLVRRGVKALVIACNTATTWGLSDLEAAGAVLGLPVIGVIQPGVEAALAASSTARIGIIGTDGTVRGGAYSHHLLQLRPEADVTAVACPLFVSLAEEGWVDGEIAQLVAERYLAPLRAKNGPDTLILGCTHYPLLRNAIQKALPDVMLVDSATATAQVVADRLAASSLLRVGAPRVGCDHFLVTDHVERFRRVGRRFLSTEPEPVELVDLTEQDDAALGPRPDDNAGARP
jgi:glutamate racemase